MSRPIFAGPKMPHPIFARPIWEDFGRNLLHLCADLQICDFLGFLSIFQSILVKSCLDPAKMGALPL